MVDEIKECTQKLIEKYGIVDAKLICAALLEKNISNERKRQLKLIKKELKGI